MSIDECRIKESYRFIIIKKAERHAAQAPALRERQPQFVPPKADQSSIVIPNVVSYEISGFKFRLTRIGRFIDAVLEFRNYLGAEQQNYHCDFNA